MTEQRNTSGKSLTGADVAGGGAGANAAPSPVAVTQADRDVAADWMSTQNYDWGYCGDVRGGKADNGLPAHFARHREAERERCARVADAWAAENKDAAESAAKSGDRQFYSELKGAMQECNAIAAEIRKGAS